MNFNLIFIILIALIIIFCIILYNGIRILLAVGKEKGMLKYEFKVTLLKIPIFKRSGSEKIIGSAEETKEDGNEDEDPDDDLRETEEGSKSTDDRSKEEISKTNEDNEEEEEISETKEYNEEEEEEEKGLMDKYKEIKPILIRLKNSKDELKNFLKNILKAIDIKKLEGNLIIGLSDHSTTIKIASWIWSIGAIVNSKKPTLLTVEPRFTEVIVDFEGKLELKINLLLSLVYVLILLTKKDIRDLIREFI